MHEGAGHTGNRPELQEEDHDSRRGRSGQTRFDKRDFTSPVPTCKFAGDITYLRTREGWLCLATVIDLCTRMVVGCAMPECMTAGIVVEALERA